MKGQNIEKHVNKKNSVVCVKLIRKQEITCMLFRATKCPTEAEKIKYARLSY